jgi:hypothetical protein
MNSGWCFVSGWRSFSSVSLRINIKMMPARPPVDTQPKSNHRQRIPRASARPSQSQPKGWPLQCYCPAVSQRHQSMPHLASFPKRQATHCGGQAWAAHFRVLVCHLMALIPTSQFGKSSDGWGQISKRVAMRPIKSTGAAWPHTTGASAARGRFSASHPKGCQSPLSSPSNPHPPPPSPPPPHRLLGSTQWSSPPSSLAGS